MKALCESYDEWKHCITIKCGIPLTAEYAEARLRALSDAKDAQTARFSVLYGAAYLGTVISWFKRALLELNTDRA